MPLNPNNVRSFHRTLYSGILETVTLLQRDDGMNASQIRTVKLFNVRWSRARKRGQQLDGDVSSDHRRELHIPQSEMDRVGVKHINPLYRFIDKDGRYWMPESDDTITQQLMMQHWCVPCQRTDPIPTSGV